MKKEESEKKLKIEIDSQKKTITKSKFWLMYMGKKRKSC